MAFQALLLLASLVNLCLGAWLFCSLLRTLHKMVRPSLAAPLAGLIYLAGSQPLVYPAGRGLGQCARLFLPNFSIFQTGFHAASTSATLLSTGLTNLAYFLVWSAYLAFCTWMFCGQREEG
ncbi:MAG: hypothetical protein KF760_04480 [Candidatus Eremiobacteraeota bacterium]|nr:hypothetical protein [Candidatus Eremiobacteraeota bacterium]MCW5866930.1 hypothetical protein [Candidatus Eremiobacteraeota bacterium]